MVRLRGFVLPGILWGARLSVLVIAGVGTAILALPSEPAFGTSYVVDTTANDPGVTQTACTGAANDCSLRGAITRANAAASPGDVITFDAAVFPSGAPATITIASTLPNLTGGSDIIDGTGAGVIIATSVFQSFSCLDVASDGNRIANLQISQCTDAIELLGTADNNTIGPGNVLFQNDTGVTVFGSGNVIRGNKVGTNAAGSAIHPSGANTRGIETAGANTTVGGANPADRNIISGNGIGLVVFANGATIHGNYVGTDVSGTIDLGNTSSGVSLQGSSGHVVGGTNPGEGNLISGNAGNMVLANVTASTIAGNIIGPDVNGSGAAMVNGSGIFAAATTTGNTIGPGNVISDVTIGVDLDGGTVANNVIKGNRIGTNLAGTAAVPNSDDGVRMENGAHDNTVGGTTAADRNIIAASGGGGGNGTVSIMQSSNNHVIGNYIGTDTTGTVDLGSNFGVRITGATATGNKIGGLLPGQRNVISGHNFANVQIDFNVPNNTVAGNIIGPDVNGSGAAMTNGTGVSVLGPGTAISNNVISDNLGGVLLSGSVVQNTVITGNFVGTDLAGNAAVPNGGGISVESSASNNMVGGTIPGEGNLIAFNTGTGVVVSGATTTGNAIRGNSIHDNGGVEISLVSGANGGIAAPTVTAAGAGGTTGTACANCEIDVFSDGAGDAEFYEGSTTADGTGNWGLVAEIAGPNVTATASNAGGNTSQLSAPSIFTAESDGDGVPDAIDNCYLTRNGPAQAAIFGVGFQADADGDGVPGSEGPEGTIWGGDACDFDDDNDGKPDNLDFCRTSPEDYDGFEDGDGCPDTDNDSDGICDTGQASVSCTGSDFGRYLWQNPLPMQQDCRNVAEDIDSFHDSDGCPEPDNDYDTFPDINDDCPAADTNVGPDGVADTGDEPILYLTPYQAREDFDGIIDTDGCHDSPGDDYDGDGLSDENEVFTAFTNPVNPDSDADGVIDVWTSARARTGSSIRWTWASTLGGWGTSARPRGVDLDVPVVLVNMYPARSGR
jgi:hypothetical protein